MEWRLSSDPGPGKDFQSEDAQSAERVTEMNEGGCFEIRDVFGQHVNTVTK